MTVKQNFFDQRHFHRHKTRNIIHEKHYRFHVLAKPYDPDRISRYSPTFHRALHVQQRAKVRDVQVGTAQDEPSTHQDVQRGQDAGKSSFEYRLGKRAGKRKDQQQGQRVEAEQDHEQKTGIVKQM